MKTKEQEILTAVPERIIKLVGKMGIEVKIEEGVIGDTTTFTIRTREGGLLIGEEGQSLMALNYILRKTLEKELKEKTPKFLVDVNDYHRKRFEELRDQARMGAQRVRYFKKEFELPPMTSFERRVIHVTLQEYPDIKTESVGLGRDRRVVIKLYS